MCVQVVENTNPNPKVRKFFLAKSFQQALLSTLKYVAGKSDKRINFKLYFSSVLNTISIPFIVSFSSKCQVTETNLINHIY